MTTHEPVSGPAQPDERAVSFVKATPFPGAGGADALEPQIDRTGTGVGALMLARYLVGRAIAARVSVVLWLVAGALLVAAVLVWIGDVHWLAVVVGLLGLMVLGVRALVMLVLRKVMAVGRLGAAEARITELVRDTGADLRRELRRIGLPGSVFGMPLLVIRILGKRRRETFDRMRRFDVANVVPKSRRAELEFIVRNELLHRTARATPRARRPAGR